MWCYTVYSKSVMIFYVLLQHQCTPTLYIPVFQLADIQFHLEISSSECMSNRFCGILLLCYAIGLNNIILFIRKKYSVLLSLLYKKVSKLPCSLFFIFILLNVAVHANLALIMFILNINASKYILSNIPAHYMCKLYC